MYMQGSIEPSLFMHTHKHTHMHVYLKRKCLESGRERDMNGGGEEKGVSREIYDVLKKLIKMLRICKIY